MSTEARNPKTVDIDLMPTTDAVAAILVEDQHAIGLVQDCADRIAQAVELSLRHIARGGGVHYFGAGASGRIAMLDATELGPTFGAPPGQVTAHFPGGDPALLDPAQDHEDAFGLGIADAAGLSAADVAFGITASGRTSYVAGAIEQARTTGATTILLTCAGTSQIKADLIIAIDTGAEAITGSTRLKAGTATKAVINAYSTALMVRLGRTFSNWMTGATVTNSKLEERATRLVQQVTGADETESRSMLQAADWRTDLALLALLTSRPLPEAAAALREHRSLRAAIQSLGSAS